MEHALRVYLLSEAAGFIILAFALKEPLTHLAKAGMAWVKARMHRH
jgi:hypothetical protein